MPNESYENRRIDREFIFEQWMKYLLFNVTDKDVLSEEESPALEISKERLRVSFAMGYRLALAQVIELLEVELEIANKTSNELEILNFVKKRFDDSYCTNRIEARAQEGLSLNLKLGHGYAMNQGSTHGWANVSYRDTD